MQDLIKKLVEAFGPSGKEDQVREIVRGEIEAHVDEISVSPLGGLHAIVNPGGGTKVMVAAHMDEIGVIISHIDENGFARFHNIGGVFPHTLVGHRVRFEENVTGVIGVEATVKNTDAPKLSQAFIDFGAGSKADCPVHIGDLGAFTRPFVTLGDRYVAKSMDDRIGVAVAIETAKRLRSTPNEIQFAFTTQEEVGLRGAKTSAYGLDPEVGIALDVTKTGDTPKGIKMAMELGRGPAIKVRDSGLLSDPRVVDLMVRRAEAARIPYQLEVLERGRTDATAIQLTRAGVPVGVISIPCRYVHTPSEMVDASDVENAVNLLQAILEHPVEL
ncbi:MAG: M42 family metallopeptidase [Anaerolineae bacterium]|nr:MAG: M42 family metallopeptidase [Anaerolineae bacterium]